MPDLKQRIMDILSVPQLTSCATVTLEGKPWVRYVVTVADADMNIRFATLLESRKAEQIRHNSEIHMTCGVNSLNDMNNYLQIQGRARISTNEADRHAFWNDKLGSVFEGPDDPNYCVVIVEPYRIEYCTQGPFEPDVWSKC
ncbi:pyridoxamine 5'-phosphate oxidase family protein [Desulfosediminicola flagellatus]|uniref:pyridoxamine 5'-phosphate oxidase family protein n=1 Tax=Desulfosediminicola flagellatus TaxID=2569541 RepID=UPI00142EF086|nr:pyridoxamine 5'-phosphate oxidase family protein [Desulfosediminicola flagellatus]